jgi:hypothetical protein
MSDARAAVQEQAALVHGLRATVYSRPDPAADPELFERLVREQAKLHDLESQPAANASPSAAAPAAGAIRAQKLGVETTGLKVDYRVNLQPLPTGIYHLLDPKEKPLVTVTVTNRAQHPRRVRVAVFLEGLSARAVKTVELERGANQKTFSLSPTLLPGAIRLITEVQWATLHVVADILGNTQEDATPERSPFPEVCEIHDTVPVLCLARTSSFNGVRDSAGALIDLTHYYGAWVTPHTEPVQERVRRAAAFTSAHQMWGYQVERASVPEQVKALYLALKEAGLTYINSVLDYGAGPGQFTQRTRLPSEALARKSANCIDGTVLMASLLEGASLNPALVFVPGHAFLAWENWTRDGTWSYLETTMIGSATFEEACTSGQKQYDAQSAHSGVVKRHALADLRQSGIYPME